MHARLRIAAVAFSLVSLTAIASAPANAAAPAAAIEETRQSIGALRTEGARLDSQLSLLDAEEREVKLIEADLKHRAAANKQEDHRLRADINSALDIKNEVDAAVLNYNSYCRGSFHSEEYRQRKAWCDANFAPLQARKNQVDATAALIKARIARLEAAEDSVTKDTLAWAQRVKTLQGKFADYDAERRDWALRLRNVISSPGFGDLQRRAGAIGECANIPGVEYFERRLNGAAEQAHRCLQKVWDGAN